MQTTRTTVSASLERKDTPLEMQRGPNKVYLEPAGKMHSYLKELMRYPPAGYEFITHETALDRSILKPLLNSNVVYFALQRNVLEKLIPMPLVKSYIERFLRKAPPDAALTYSYGHPIFRKEPWVVEVEWATQLTGFSAAHLRRYKGILEKVLASAHCKKIICWCELCRNTVLASMDCSQVHHKIEIVPHAVAKKGFMKVYDDDRVRLLFVGSANISGEFDLKGGKEALEAFRLLSSKYDNLELVVRSDVPPSIKKEYEGIPGLKIIEGALPQKLLEREFLSADLFLFPGHHTPFMSLLDALSYELPVVTTDVYANGEIVANGVTGFVVPASDHVPYYVRKFTPDGRSARFRKAIKELDHQVVHDIVDRTSILIENPELRRRMGKAGRGEVENGRFSIQNRNEKLKRVFDEAVGEA
jgi:glycosyltransferase involved in cell wall biosynthesis